MKYKISCSSVKKVKFDFKSLVCHTQYLIISRIVLSVSFLQSNIGKLPVKKTSLLIATRRYFSKKCVNAEFTTGQSKKTCEKLSIGGGLYPFF